MDCKASIPDLCTLTYFGILSAHLLGELIIHQVGSDPKKKLFFFDKITFPITNNDVFHLKNTYFGDLCYIGVLSIIILACCL